MKQLLNLVESICNFISSSQKQNATMLQLLATDDPRAAIVEFAQLIESAR